MTKKKQKKKKTEKMDKQIMNSTLVGHFVSSPRGREKRDRRDIKKDRGKEHDLSPDRRARLILHILCLEILSP